MPEAEKRKTSEPHNTGFLKIRLLEGVTQLNSVDMRGYNYIPNEF